MSASPAPACTTHTTPRLLSASQQPVQVPSRAPAPRGNGRIIDELERLFAGAGWNVIKLVWGSDWDGLFARDLTGALARALEGTVDGQMQTFAAKDGRFNRDNFFGQNPELAALAQGMTDEQIDRLKRGGHDLVKIHAAYAAAAAHKGQPTVILAHTKKGYGMGTAGQGKMTTHSQKKLDGGDLIEFRNRFNLPLSDEQATSLAFYKPAEDSAEMQYLRSHRQQHRAFFIYVQRVDASFMARHDRLDGSDQRLGLVCTRAIQLGQMHKQHRHAPQLSQPGTLSGIIAIEHGWRYTGTQRRSQRGPQDGLLARLDQRGSSQGNQPQPGIIRKWLADRSRSESRCYRWSQHNLGGRRLRPHQACFRQSRAAEHKLPATRMSTQLTQRRVPQSHSDAHRHPHPMYGLPSR